MAAVAAVAAAFVMVPVLVLVVALAVALAVVDGTQKIDCYQFLYLDHKQ